MICTELLEWYSKALLKPYWWLCEKRNIFSYKMCIALSHVEVSYLMTLLIKYNFNVLLLIEVTKTISNNYCVQALCVLCMIAEILYEQRSLLTLLSD